MYYTTSTQETTKLGEACGKRIVAPLVLCCQGDLGSGKTTFLKGLIHTISGTAKEEISSPTFSYLHIYAGLFPLFHFDLYRLTGVDDFLGFGFDEYLFSYAISCIEWSERISCLLPEKRVSILLTHEEEGKRAICLSDPYHLLLPGAS